MKRLFSILSLPFFLLLLFPLKIQADTLPLNPSADTSVKNGSSSDFGAAQGLTINARSADRQRLLLQFDLSGIPSGSVINSATLRLCLAATQGAARTYRVHRLTRSWVEGTHTGTGTADGATYATYDGTNTWTSGGEFDSTVIASDLANWDANLSDCVDDPDDRLEFNVKSSVSDFVRNVSPNDGWIIKDSNEGGTQFYWTVHSKEAPTVSNRPLLTIDYVPNTTPTADAGADAVVTDGASINLSGSCSDPDAGADLTGTWIQTSGTSCGSLSGSPVSGTSPLAAVASCAAPDVAANDILTFRLDCNDTYLTGSDSVAITVNARPTANAGIDQSVNDSVGSRVLDGTGSSDPNSEALTYSWTETADPESVCSLANPSSSQPAVSIANKKVTGTYSCTYSLIVNDGLQNSTADTVNLDITGDNDPPILNNPGDKTIAEGSPLNFTLSGTEPEGDPIVYSCVTGCPAGLSVNTTNGDVSFTPGYNQAGAYNVSFGVSDPEGNISSQAITLTVPNTDTTPNLADPGDKKIRKGDPLSFTLTGSDTDGDPLTYSCSANCPAGLSVNATSGLVSGTPQGGFYDNVTFKAGDPAGHFATRAITIGIIDVIVSQPGGSTSVTEGSLDDTYTVVLATEPTANVTVTLSSDTQISLNPSVITFTPSDWDIVQTVTVTAVNDDQAEGNHTATISQSVVSPDPLYQGFSVDNIIVNIVDNDAAGVSLAESGGATSVSEGGAPDSYTLTLTSEPINPVTLTVNANLACSVLPSTIVFNPTDWNIPQTVTVTANNNSTAEGTRPCAIAHSSSSGDPAYNGIAVASVNASITDNDSAGITIVESDGSTFVSLGGLTDTYTVVLTSAPQADVFINMGHDSIVGVSPPTLLFTAGNWNIPQMITVSAATISSTIPSTTLVHQASSPDPNYNALPIRSVTVTLISDLPGNGGGEQDGGDEGAGTGGGTGEPPQDQPVIADAGEPETLLAGQSLKLDGSGSQGTGLTYQWTISSGGGSLDDPTATSPLYTGPQETQTVTITLTITDSDGNVSTDSVILHILSPSTTQGSVWPDRMAANLNNMILHQQSQEGRILLHLDATGLPLLLSGETTNYTLEGSPEWPLIVGEPDVENATGRVSMIQNIAQANLIDLNEILPIPSNSLTDPASGDISAIQDMIESGNGMVTLSGSEPGDRFGEFLATVDLNNDGTEELVISAPGVKPHGALSIYNKDLSPVATLLGSPDHPPLSSAIFSDVVGNDKRPDLLLGPNNRALNLTLSRQNEISTAEMISSGFLLSGRKGFEGAINLSERGTDAELGGSASHQSAAFGDANGDQFPDLLLCSNEGKAYLYLGPIDEESVQTKEDADSVIGDAPLTEGFCLISVMADVTGDGYDDMLIGAPSRGPDLVGAIYVVFGSSQIQPAVSLSSPRVMILKGESPSDRIGSDLVLYDSDKNGVSEIYTLKGDSKVYRFDLSSTPSKSLGNEGIDGEDFDTSNDVTGGGGCSCRIHGSKTPDPLSLEGRGRVWLLLLIVWIGLLSASRVNKIKTFIIKKFPIGSES